MALDSTVANPPAAFRFQWHRSLVMRVVLLCVVLVLCLFGAVYFLTGHYYVQVVQEVDRRAAQAADEIQVYLDTNPNIANEIDVESLPPLGDGELLEIDFVVDAAVEESIQPAMDSEGYSFIATRPILLENGEVATVRLQFSFEPGTETIRAFKNRYLLVLSLVFLLTLAGLIYLIMQALRPLQKLSETCADISEGNLHDVPVNGSTLEIRVLGDTFNRMVASLREKEKVEANLRQAQRLSAIGNLAAGVAHDVRNPLNAIKLLSSQALDRLREEGDRESPAKHLETIRNEVDRLEDIVSGFLSLAKEEQLRRERVRLEPILNEDFTLVAKEAEKRRVKMTEELRTQNVVLDLDPKQFSRALLNVLINALDACEAGGRVRLLSRVSGSWCEIEVRDDGPGMTSDVLEQAFDPYFTTKTTGTGLGLSITRGIVEEHGGMIEVFSSPDTGTQVIIRLPLPEESAHA